MQKPPQSLRLRGRCLPAGMGTAGVCGSGQIKTNLNYTNTTNNTTNNNDAKTTPLNKPEHSGKGHVDPYKPSRRLCSAAHPGGQSVRLGHGPHFSRPSFVTVRRAGRSGWHRVHAAAAVPCRTPAPGDAVGSEGLYRALRASPA